MLPICNPVSIYVINSHSEKSNILEKGKSLAHQ
jgi:hypothetical protein